MKDILLIILLFLTFNSFSQLPVNCDGAIEGCSTPSFPIVGVNPGYNITDFGTGTISNPSTNPNPGNAGCLLSGETVSTFISINVVSSGTLEWTMQGSTSSGFFDWIMWPYTYPAPGAVSPTCAMLQNGTQPPVACNWNAASNGLTGMSSPGSLPAGANPGNFEDALNVTAGETFLLCLSNYSGTNQNVNLSFGGTASVVCGVAAPDQTICNGDTATVTIITPGLATPTFNWLVTTGVSNTSGGTNVAVFPTVTTTYQVEVTQPGGLGVPNFVDTATFTIFVVNPPVPNAGADQTVCLGAPINLSAIASDSLNPVLWQYLAPATSPAPVVTFSPNFSDPNAIVTVDQVGVYEFYFRESNTVCGDVYDTVQVLVSDLVISASSVEPTCQGLSDGEIHIDSPGANEYSFDNGVTWQVDSFAFVFAAGTYDVCARTPLGCLKCTTVTVVDPVPVTVTVSNDTLICQNGTAYLSAVGTGGTTYLFHWDFTSSTAQTQIVNPSANTSYSVYAENENGCLSTSEIINVTIRPPISGTISNWDTVCPTYSTDIIATASGGLGQPYTFTWSTGDVFTGPPLNSVQVSPVATTMYTVTITDECESTPLVLQTNVRVSPLPVPQYTVLNPNQCEPAIFEIVNTTDPTISQFVYWNVNNDVEFVNQDTIFTQELWAGQYGFQMIVTSFEGCVDSLTFDNVLTVDPKPEAIFHYSPEPVTMFNTNVDFINYSLNGYSYQWFFEGGTPVSSIQEDVMVQYPEGIEGTYEVMMIVTSELGCADTTIQLVRVLPELILFSPNTFTPDGDQYNQTWKIHIQGIDIYDFDLFIYNRWGELVWESHDPSVGWDGTYNGKPVSDGTYSWVIKVGDLTNDKRHTFNGHVNIIR